MGFHSRNTDCSEVPQFDVHRLGKGLVIDCQSNRLADLNTRVVAPLIPKDSAPVPAHRLNPIFPVDGQDYVMDTQFISAIERRTLGTVITSLADRSFEITDAIDVLISGA